MSETYDLYQQGRAHLRKGRAAQATVALEKASWEYMRDKNYEGMRNFLADDGLLAPGTDLTWLIDTTTVLVAA